MAVPTRIELAIFCVTGRRDNRYTTEPNWLREMDLNQRPLGYEPNELPSCSIPRYTVFKKWRRKRDSNPCAAYTTSWFSRPVPSTGLGYSSVLSFDNKLIITQLFFVCQSFCLIYLACRHDSTKYYLLL